MTASTTALAREIAESRADLAAANRMPRNPTTERWRRELLTNLIRLARAQRHRTGRAS
jgi:hypothetical protein